MLPAGVETSTPSETNLLITCLEPCFIDNEAACLLCLRIETSLKLSRTLKSNKDLTYRALAQIASSVPKRVRFDKVDFDGRNRITIQGVAATDQDILKFIDNLGKQKLVSQASLSSMRLPKRSRGGASMKGFRVFVTLKKG